MSEVREGICVCGATFEIPAKRGRPPVRCAECREAYANGTLPDRLHSLGVDTAVLRQPKNKFRPTSTPTGEIKNAQRGDENEKAEPIITVSERLDQLEMLLKSRNLHISQHRDKW